MATVTKTQGTSLFTAQQLNANSVLKSNVQDVSSKFAATIFINFGLIDTTGVLSSGVEFRLEASARSTGNDQWFPFITYKTSVLAPESEAVSGAAASGATVINVASTTNLAIGNIILFKNTTIGNSEFARIRALSTNTNITLIDGLTNTQTGSTIYNRAEKFASSIDLTAIGRIRLVADGSNTNKNTLIQAYLITGDSIS